MYVCTLYSTGRGKPCPLYLILKLENYIHLKHDFKQQLSWVECWQFLVRGVTWVAVGWNSWACRATPPPLRHSPRRTELSAWECPVSSAWAALASLWSHPPLDDGRRHCYPDDGRPHCEPEDWRRCLHCRLCWERWPQPPAPPESVCWTPVPPTIYGR